MDDLTLGVVALIVAAVPVSLLVLLLADGAGLDGEGRGRRRIRTALAVLAVPALAWTGVAAWGWAGAAHLEPLCHAYAGPEFRAVRRVEARGLLLDAGDAPAAAAPPWSAAFPALLGQPLLTDPGSAAGSAATHVLEVRRVVHHANLWFTVTMDRFRLLDRGQGTVLAEGDEAWIEAGRARYQCGIVSGPLPVRADRTPWPGGDGVARFVRRGLEPADATPDVVDKVSISPLL